VPTSYRFTGQRWDGVIRLYDYNARYYDLAIGRFIQPDPIVPEPGNPQGLNRYSYVNNNPVRYVDPTGHYYIVSGEPETPSLLAVRPSNVSRTGYEILYGGKEYPNYVEKALANLELTGLAKYLYQLPAPRRDPVFDAAMQVFEKAADFRIHYNDKGEIDIEATLQDASEILLPCAKAVEGVCGISLGFTLATPVGMVGTLDFILDVNGEMGVYGTLGGAGFASPGVTGTVGYSAIAIPLANVSDYEGWSVFGGGSFTYGKGGGVDVVVFSSSGRTFVGVVIGGDIGLSWEIHGGATYSITTYSIRIY